MGNLVELWRLLVDEISMKCLLLVIWFCCAPLICGQTHSNAPKVGPAAVAVSKTETAKVAARQLGLTDGLFGIARPHHRVNISPSVSGLLSKLLVKEGQTVKRGAPLAIIDNRLVQADVAVARVSAESKATIAHAEYELSLAESLYRRLNSTAGDIGVADHELEEAKVRRDQARAKLDSARQEHEEARRRLARERARLEMYTIRAPFDGTILEVSVHPGAALAIGDTVMSLANLRQLEVEVHAPLRLFGKLVVGRSYRLRAGPPLRRVLEGRLEFASPSIDATMESFRCKFSILNPELNLPAGFPVQFVDLAAEDIAGQNSP